MGATGVDGKEEEDAGEYVGMLGKGRDEGAFEEVERVGEATEGRELGASVEEGGGVVSSAAAAAAAAAAAEGRRR